jgi:hypothetical protein
MAPQQPAGDPGVPPRPADALPASPPPLAGDEPQQKTKTSDWLAGRSFPSWDAIRERCDQTRRGFEKGPNTAGGERSRRHWVCENCGRSFRAKPVHDARGPRMPRRFCSARCNGANQSAMHLARARDHKARLKSLEEARYKIAQAGEDEQVKAAARLHANTMGMIRVMLPEAHEAVMGTREWSATQAKVFIALLNKVLPDAPKGNTTRGSGANRPVVL